MKSLVLPSGRGIAVGVVILLVAAVLVVTNTELASTFAGGMWGPN